MFGRGDRKWKRDRWQVTDCKYGKAGKETTHKLSIEVLSASPATSSVRLE